MSTITIQMCDIKDCREEATEHLDIMLVCRQEGKKQDGSFKIYTEKEVDLCGRHELEYRRVLPDMRIERKEPKK